MTSVNWGSHASDKKHQVWKMKPAAKKSTSNISSSYLRRCLKRACMVSWLGLGSCLTSSLVDWTRCLGSGFSAGDKQSQRADRSALGRPQCSSEPTDGVDKVVEERVGEQGLGQLPEVHLQSSSGHVNVLPLPVLQVHLLVCAQDKRDESGRHYQKSGRT